MHEQAPIPSPSLLVSGEPRDGDFWVVVSGELDLATSEELRAALASMDLHPGGTVRIGVADVDFVDADSLEQLVTFVRATRLSGRLVGIDGARGVVRRMAGLMGFEDELAVA